MLRRRAEQNRLDSLNIDYDDDECHGSDESEFDAIDGEDSVMESPFNQDILHNGVGETDFDEDDEVGDDDFDSADGDIAVEGGHRDFEGQISNESTQNKWSYGNLQMAQRIKICRMSHAHHLTVRMPLSLIRLMVQQMVVGFNRIMRR